MLTKKLKTINKLINQRAIGLTLTKYQTEKKEKMECFIKKVIERRVDEKAHAQFVRFGKGNYPGRAVLKLRKDNKIKLGGSFEYANDFAILASELGEINFSGIVLSKEELQGLSGKKKAGLYEYNFSGNSEEVKRIIERAYYMLLDGEGSGISLKVKKKVPKPGKSGESKIDDKFCLLEADLKYWQQIKEAFILPECKKAEISHTYIIEEIILPQGEKDFEKIRILAKRKGRLIRQIKVDGVERKEEKEFEA